MRRQEAGWTRSSMQNGYRDFRGSPDAAAHHQNLAQPPRGAHRNCVRAASSVRSGVGCVGVIVRRGGNALAALNGGCADMHGARLLRARRAHKEGPSAGAPRLLSAPPPPGRGRRSPKTRAPSGPSAPQQPRAPAARRRAAARPHAARRLEPTPPTAARLHGASSHADAAASAASASNRDSAAARPLPHAARAALRRRAPCAEAADASLCPRSSAAQ